DWVRDMACTRLEVYRMKLKAERNKQKHFQIRMLRSGCLVCQKLMPQVRCGLFLFKQPGFLNKE
ncbi:MAG: hypothetical protein PVF53_02405, partial [Desulfobacterales bacterium]